MTSRILSVIIADDEPLARQALRRFVSADADVVIVAEADDVPTLQELLRTQRADVLFLDITMPGGSGLDAIPFVPASMAVVFTTAHAEHAATAFEIDAVDYLVKPFGSDRVREALARVRRLRAASTADTNPPLSVLLVRLGTRIQPVAVSAIWRLEGSDDFVRVVTAEKSWLHGITLSNLASQLDASVFMRVHRSHVVNLTHVVRAMPSDERRLAAEFPDGSRVICSRAGSVALRKRMRITAG